MAEAVRRYRETGESDVVRRLLARPIRLAPPHPAARPAGLVPIEAETEATASEAAPSEAEAVAPDSAGDEEAEGGAEVVAGLQAEMAVMKAILMAERAESAALRARIEGAAEADTLGPEARATRERWASIVDRLLLSAR